MAVVLHSSCRRQHGLVPLLGVLLVWWCWVLVVSSPIIAAARPSWIDDQQQAAAACLDCIARTGCQYCLAESIDLYNEGGDYCECDDDDAADQAMAEEDHGYYDGTEKKGSSCLVTREECAIMDHLGAILHFFEVLFLFLWFSVVLQCLCACACIGGCVYFLSGGGDSCCSISAASGSTTTAVVSNNYYYRAQEGGSTTTTTTQYAVLVGSAKSLS
jgi:hypothetical protein